MDPVRRAAGICVGIGVLNLLCGLIAMGVAPDGMSKALGPIAMIVGIIYFGLGWGISNGSFLCAVCAVVLQLGNFGMLMAQKNPGGPPIVGLMINVSILFALGKGASDLWEAQKTYTPTPPLSRPDPYANQAAMYAAPRPPSQRLASPSTGRPSGRQPAAAPAPAPAPKGPVMKCPNCHKTYPMGTKQCGACKIATFED